uniref:Dual specificity protein phosphatase n=1 Tax=Prolemur simus TaxID=1328070 RepID=A0A8C8Z1J4_PROSS
MCPGNWLWASMTFMARFSRSSSRSPVRTRGTLEEMPTVQHPFLNVFELERLLYTGKTACNHADEVWPGLYLGDQDMANNRRELRRLGITHVLNASHSRWRGPPEAYQALGIRYLGVEAHDSPAFDMSVHFQTAADFIHRALSQSWCTVPWEPSRRSRTTEASFPTEASCGSSWLWTAGCGRVWRHEVGGAGRERKPGLWVGPWLAGKERRPRWQVAAFPGNPSSPGGGE